MPRASGSRPPVGFAETAKARNHAGMATTPAPKKAPNKARKPATAGKGAGSAVPGKQRTDWEAVERDYRTGKFTDGELSVSHSVTREAIVRRRGREQKADPTRWARDLAPHVRAATNALLMKETVADAITQDHTKVTGVVMAAAEVNTRVIMAHRTGLQALTQVKRSLLAQIEQAAANMADLSEIIEMARNPDENGMDRANDALRKAMGRSALVDDLKKLADVDEKVRKGEREAFGLDDASKPESDGLAAMATAELQKLRERLIND